MVKIRYMLPKLTRLTVASLVILFLATISGAAPGRSFQGSPVEITIDAGHGGYDPGAVVEGISEKSVNLEIVLKIKELGKHHPRLEFTFTRLSDDHLPLLDRVALARDANSDGYLSIQANTFWDQDVHGVETILDKTRPRESESWKMAESIQDSVVKQTGARDRGIRYQRLYTRYTQIPSALIEVGFLTSPGEREKLTDPGYQETIARGIVRGLLLHFSRESS